MSIREFAVINYRKFYACFISIILLFMVNNKTFANTSSMSPAVNATIVVSNQQLINTQSFARIDNFMSLPEKERVLMRYNDKYAYTGAGQQVFSPTFIPDEHAGIWIKQYTLFEEIPLGNGPNVSNVGYGTTIGTDTKLKHFRNGWDGGLTFHITYQGSRENFNNTSSIDDIGSGGITGALFKKNFFVAATAATGGGYTHDNIGIGEQNYRVFTSSVTCKTGYNFEFKNGKYILQPSFLGDYIYAVVSNFVSKDGKAETGDPIHAIHLSPGIKLIGNFKGGWQPYLSLSVTWTLMDSPAIFIDGALQERVHIDPYCEYGFGLQRRWEEKYTSFGQVLMRGGGRNGVSLFAGFRVALGTEKKQRIKTKKKETQDKPENPPDKMIEEQNKQPQNEDTIENTPLNRKQNEPTESQDASNSMTQQILQNDNTDEENEQTQE